VAVVAAPITTADELLRMPDDGLRHELVGFTVAVAELFA
jgi:hypothetical protein